MSKLLLGSVLAVSLAGLMSGQRPVRTPAHDSRQTVYTVKGEYEIIPSADGKAWMLRRLSRDGTPYETIPLTRKSEKSGGDVYVDGNGNSYTRLSDGKLQESLTFDATSAGAVPPPAQAAGTALRLMTAAPVLPRSGATNGARTSNITLPGGVPPLRREKGLLFLTTGIDDQGKRREVVVQNVSANWYVRTSVSNDPNESPAFRLEDDGTVSGFRQLPAGVPQLRTVNRPDDSGPVLAAILVAAPVATPPPAPPQGIRHVDYEGRSATILTRSDSNGQHTYLNFDGEPDSLELESVRGISNLFTPRGRNDITVFLDRQNKLTATDASARAVPLAGLRSPVAPAAPAAPLPRPEHHEANVIFDFSYQKTGEDQVTITSFTASGVKSAVTAKPVRDASGIASDDQAFVKDGEKGFTLYFRTMLPDGRKALTTMSLSPLSQ